MFTLTSSTDWGIAREAKATALEGQVGLTSPAVPTGKNVPGGEGREFPAQFLMSGWVVSPGGHHDCT